MISDCLAHHTQQLPVSLRAPLIFHPTQTIASSTTYLQSQYLFPLFSFSPPSFFPPIVALSIPSPLLYSSDRLHPIVSNSTPSPPRNDFTDSCNPPFPLFKRHTA